MMLGSFTLWPEDIPKTAILVEGTVRRAGLPGFTPNRIPALSGRYETDDGLSFLVWGTTEPLLFDPSVWTQRDFGMERMQRTVTVDGKQLWCASRTYPMREGMKAYSKWTFVISTEKNVRENACVFFLKSFIARTEFFFSSSRRVEDLSFPATFEITGKI